MKNSEEFVKAAAESIEKCDEEQLTAVCNKLVAFISDPDAEFPPADAEHILFLLRSSLHFRLMQKVGDAFIEKGRGTYNIYRQYAQALIEQENFLLAKYLLEDLVVKTRQVENDAAKNENAEARGLLGRTYKQLFINSTRAVNSFALDYFYKAIPFYKEAYDEKPEENLWHGINTASLLFLAKREKIPVTDMPEPEKIARDILEVIGNKPFKKISCWDYATAAEASIIIGDWDAAKDHISKYLASADVSWFAIRSTLRQFTEVLKLESEPRAAAILMALTVALEKEAKQPSFKSNGGFELAFGNAAYQTLEWYEKGLARGVAVARIGVEATKGSGTGFLIRGSKLSDKLNEDFVLLTNAHVITNDEDVIAKMQRKPHRPDDICVIFEKESFKEGKPQEKFCIESVYWTSDPWTLDTTVAKFRPEHQARVNEIGEKSDFFPFAKDLPRLPDATQKVFIIGHPHGGTLSFSLEDNQLLDHESPRIHYRTPTDPGSSGSPVFNRKWELLGIHHKGSLQLPKLNKQTGTYEANEALWIRSIIEAIKADGK